MNNVKFRELVTDMRRVWTDRDGVIARLSRCKPGTCEELRICVGPITNANEVVAARCNAWRGNDLVYSGQLNSPALRQLITRGKYIKAFVTTYKCIDQTPRWKCYSATCVKACRLRR